MVEACGWATGSEDKVWRPLYHILIPTRKYLPWKRHGITKAALIIRHDGCLNRVAIYGGRGEDCTWAQKHELPLETYLITAASQYPTCQQQGLILRSDHGTIP